MAIEPSNAFATPGEIARLANVSEHRVQYLIRSRNLKPIGRAGHIRVFGPEDGVLPADVKKVILSTPVRAVGRWPSKDSWELSVNGG